MDDRATGLVLRARPYSDTSLILHWLTLEHGLLATLAQGARRPKSPHRGKLDLGFRVEFSFRRSRRSDLHTLREARIQETHPHLRKNWQAVEQWAYATRLVERALETDTPVPAAFELLNRFLDHCRHSDLSPLPLLAMELGLLSEQGWLPDPDQAPLSRPEKDLARQLMIGQLPDIRPPRRPIQNLAGWLGSRIQESLEGQPKGRAQALHLESLV